MTEQPQLISVIVTTYNWSEALVLCLNSLFEQTDRNFEIIIADDGSAPAHVERVTAHCLHSPVAVRHVYHEDQGFRAGTIRNKAVAQSTGNYLLFVDGDCLLPPDFIARHRQLAQPGCFVPGNRVLLSRKFTEQVIAAQLPVYRNDFFAYLRLRWQGKLNRCSAFIKLPLGKLRHWQPAKWQKAMTCNLAIWRNDFIQVNGFDEAFEGWGYEDSDLVIRLIHAGIQRKEGRFAVPVLHLWHAHHDRSRHDLNYQRLQERLHQPDCIRAKQGLTQYLR